MLSAELDNSVLDLFHSPLFVLLFIFFKVLTTLLPRGLSSKHLLISGMVFFSLQMLLKK